MIKTVPFHSSLLPFLLLCVIFLSGNHQRILADAQPQQRHTGPGGHRHGRWWKNNRSNYNTANDDKRGGGDGTKNDHDGGFIDPLTVNAIRTLLKQPKPRGLFHGIWKLSKCTIQGVLVGAASLFAFPVATMSLFGTAVVGPATILIATVMGGLFGFGALGYNLWNGINQCFWGLVNFPKAIQSWWRGWVWNPQTERWEAYSLSEDYETSLRKSNEPLMGRGKNHYYYQLLEVPTTATKSQIRRAYHKAAKKIHPDKNPSATIEQFLMIHQAYEILSDEIQRAKYNESGDGGNISNSSILPLDPKTYFSILLDSYDVLHPYIGDLPIIQWALAVIRSGLLSFDDDDDDDVAESIEMILQHLAASKQRAESRQVFIAIHLREIIEPYVSGLITKEKFRLWAACEARRIYHNGAIGARQQALVGQALQRSTYLTASSQRIVLLWPLLNAVALIRRTVEEFQKNCTLLCTSFQLVKHFTSTSINSIHEEAGDDSNCQLILSQFLRVVQILNELDISNTIDGAIWKLLHDSTISRVERLKRARAVEIVGEEFSKVAGESQGDITPLSNDELDRLKIAEYLAGYESKVPFENLPNEVRRLERNGHSDSEHPRGGSQSSTDMECERKLTHS